MSKTGIFGGSFNPIHMGHIIAANNAVELLKLDRILIMPTYLPPHKSAVEYAGLNDRIEMCRLASHRIKGAEVSLIEALRKGVSYTSDTLSQIKEIYPDDELFLIIGADMFLTLQEWHEPKTVFALAKICVLPRDNSDIAVLERQSEMLSEIGAESIILQVPEFNVSSTQIRNNIKKGESISGLVCAEVEEYILKNELYKGVSKDV